MWKAALAGAIALATLGSFSHEGIGIAPAVAQETVITEAHIARLHTALRLTPAQEGHWRAVAATLRRLGHQQQQYQLASSDGGFVERAHARVAGYTLTAVTMQRLKAAAQPLVAMLTEEQKQAGRDVLASMGVSF